MRLLWFLLVVPYSVLLQGCSSCNVKLVNQTLTPSLTESTFQGPLTQFGMCPEAGGQCQAGATNPWSFGPGTVMVGYDDHTAGCPNSPGTCAEAYIISRGLVQFDLTPLNGHSPVSATLLFQMTQASFPLDSVLAAIGTGTQPPPGSDCQCLAPMDVFLNLPTGPGLNVNQGWLKIANSTDFSVDVTREVRDWTAGGKQNYGFVLAGVDEQPPAKDTSGFSVYGRFGLNVTYNPNP